MQRRLQIHKENDTDIVLLTVIGLGSRIRVINFIAPNDSQGGQVNSAAEICT